LLKICLLPTQWWFCSVSIDSSCLDCVVFSISSHALYTRFYNRYIIRLRLLWFFKLLIFALSSSYIQADHPKLTEVWLCTLLVQVDRYKFRNLMGLLSPSVWKEWNLNSVFPSCGQQLQSGSSFPTLSIVAFVLIWFCGESGFLFFSFFLCFCATGVWTQGLVLAR
jgi:hypothetical protein